MLAQCHLTAGRRNTIMMKPLFLGTLLLHMLLDPSSFGFLRVVEAFPSCSVSLLVHNTDNIKHNLHCGHFSSICTITSSSRQRSSYCPRISVLNSLFGRGGDEEHRQSNSSLSSSSLRVINISSNTTAEPVIVNGKSPSVNISTHVSSSSSSSLRNTMGTSLRDSIMVTREKDNSVMGIGGNGGVVYNVNILKRNLLQETMNAYKAELYHILNSPMSSEYYILTKLAALVQGSPVVTTTDSNLMDGSWTLAYQSKHSFVHDLKQLQLDLIIRKGRRTTTASSSISSSNSRSTAAKDAHREREHYKKMRPAMRRRSGKETAITRQRRTFGLETLEEDEDPYVMDETLYLGGLFSKQKHYQVQSLTRNSLRLTPISRQYFCLGKRLGSGKRYSSVAPQVFNTMDMRIIYSDGHLCIISNDIDPITSTNNGNGNNKDQTTYKVYTKHEAWTNTNQRLRRIIHFLASFVIFTLSRLVPGRHADDVYGVYSEQEGGQRGMLFSSKDSGLLEDPIVKEIRFDQSARLRVLRLGSPGAESGDYDDDDDDNNSSIKQNNVGGGRRGASRKRNNDNAAWEGIEDPFVHLTADDRQTILKRLSVGEVEQAGNRFRSKTIRDRWLKPGGVFAAARPRHKFFHPPSKGNDNETSKKSPP